MTLVLKSKRNHRGIVDDIIQFLDINYTDIDCRKGLSGKFGIDESYLCRLFKESTESTISSYINNKRVELAKMLLIDNDTRVVDVAYHIGFNNLSHFHRIFKHHTGFTPLAYARKNAAQKLVG